VTGPVGANATDRLDAVIARNDGESLASGSQALPPVDGMKRKPIGELDIPCGVCGELVTVNVRSKPRSTRDETDAAICSEITRRGWDAPTPQHCACPRCARQTEETS
jgi:hypothetical protein